MCFADAFIIEKMPKENKRKRLTFQEKHQLVREVKAGVSKQNVLQKYGISERMYREVTAREADLNNKSKNYEYLNKKSSKTSSDVLLDAAVFEWFKQARDRGDPVNGPIIQEKARILNEKLNGPQTFKASNGWLYGFKRRYGIRLKDEKWSSDPSSAAEFSPILKTKIKSENLKQDNIYNADESGILWRQLMACTVPLHLEEKEVSKRKECKDRVTALFCANASGNHRIPLLLIGKSETPTSLNNLITNNSEDQRLKNLESLGVIYTHQASAWMDQCIFLLWYKDEFIPRVLERQRNDGITGKVVLLLDNAPSHPSLDELNAINENFEVIYLPPSVPALIQPMAQGLIAMTKKLFKQNLLGRLLLSEKSEEADQFLKELDLPDFFGMLSLAWDALESSTLQKSWKPLLSNSLLALQKTNIKLGEEDPLSIDDAVLSEPESPTDSISFPHEICDQVSELLSGPDYSIQKSREYLLKWFNNDDNDNDCGWEPLSDSDIASLVTTRRREPESVTKVANSETRFENSHFVNFVTCGKLEPESVARIENSENAFDSPDIVNFVTTGRNEPQIVNNIENSGILFQNPDIVNFVANVKREPETENSESRFENSSIVDFVTCGKVEPESVARIENSETVFESPDILNFVTTGRNEPEIVNNIENSEIRVENPDIVSLVTSGRNEPEILTEIENSKTRFENSNIVNFVTNVKREPEIENSEIGLDNSDPMEVTSSEAFGYLMKFKNWAKSRADCLPNYLDCIQVLENWSTVHK